jgi:hypothetical protein
LVGAGVDFLVAVAFGVAFLVAVDAAEVVAAGDLVAEADGDGAA